MRGRTSIHHHNCLPFLSSCEWHFCPQKLQNPTYSSTGWPHPSFTFPYLSESLPCMWGFLDVQNLFFLVLICLISIWLLDQPKNHWRVGGKFFLPNTAKETTWLLQRGEKGGKQDREKLNSHGVNVTGSCSDRDQIWPHAYLWTHHWGTGNANIVGSIPILNSTFMAESMWSCPSWSHE